VSSDHASNKSSVNKTVLDRVPEGNLLRGDFGRFRGAASCDSDSDEGNMTAVENSSRRFHSERVLRLKSQFRCRHLKVFSMLSNAQNVDRFVCELPKFQSFWLKNRSRSCLAPFPHQSQTDQRPVPGDLPITRLRVFKDGQFLAIVDNSWQSNWFGINLGERRDIKRKTPTGWVTGEGFLKLF
jgi:hypothetical protein